MKKRMISILLIIVLCLGLCACSEDESQDRNEEEKESSAEVELCVELQAEIIAVCEAYWKEDIDKERARDKLEKIEEKYKQESAIFQLRQAVLFAGENSMFSDLSLVFNNASTYRDLLKIYEEDIKSCVFNNPKDREQKIAMQVQEDLLEVYEQYWEMKISGGQATQKVGEIISTWWEKSNVLGFYRTLDGIFDRYNDYGFNESTAAYYKESIESFNFNSTSTFIIEPIWD